MTVTKSQSAPLVVVVGATGNQGGAVLKELLKSDKEYRLRALTRDTTKLTARKIEEHGVETFQIDLKPENQDKMVEAFSGADVVFAVTNFWEHMDAGRETSEGKAMVDAAIEAKVQLFIFSGLPSPKKLTNGKHSKAYHLDSKAAVDDYGISKISDSFNYRTVQAAIFYSAFQGKDELNFFLKDKDGVFYTDLPASVEQANRLAVPLIDIVNDFGLWVRAIIEVKEVREDSRPVLCQSDELKFDELMKLMAEATGKKFIIKSHTPADFAATFPKGTPAAVIEDVNAVWDYSFDVGYWVGQDPHWATRYLARKPTSFADWLKKVDLSYYQQ